MYTSSCEKSNEEKSWVSRNLVLWIDGRQDETCDEIKIFLFSVAIRFRLDSAEKWNRYDDAAADNKNGSTSGNKSTSKGEHRATRLAFTDAKENATKSKFNYVFPFKLVKW